MDLEHRTFLDTLGGIAEVIVVSAWRLISWIVTGVIKGIWSFIKAILGNVYGRIVVGLGGIIYLYLAGVFFHLIK